MTAPRPPEFASKEAYAESLADVSMWAPLAQAALARHGLQPPTGLRMGDTATFPVVVGDERWAIKFFPNSPDGAKCLAVERDVLTLLRNAPEFPAPRLIAAGELFDADTEWPWPYLVMTVVQGVSLGSVHASVSAGDLRRTAEWLGAHVRALHHFDLAQVPSLTPTWEAFAGHLSWQRSTCAERHRAWGLAPRLLAEIEAYVPEAEALLDRTCQPLLLHGDLHAWHIYGSFASGRFEPGKVIDFGDALMGDLFYELVPLHLKTFRGNKRLLRAFLDGYGLPLDLDDTFAQRAMCFTLLFDFGRLRWIDTSSADSLDDLASQLWNEHRPCTVAIRPGPWTIST